MKTKTKNSKLHMAMMKSLILKISSPFISSAFNYTYNRWLASGILRVHLKYTEMSHYLRM